MTSIDGSYFVQHELKIPSVHHQSFKLLWETKWKKPCEMDVYPFMFAAVEDFEPIVENLVKQGAREPYDWEAYAKVFFPQAGGLVGEAETAEKGGDKQKAQELYLRASAVYRISRMPIPRSPQQHLAWQRGKEACLKGLSLRQYPVREVLIPHTTHATSFDGSSIPAYHLLPPTATSSCPAPLILIICGLDGYRTDLAVWMEPFRLAGCGTLVADIPGTGDNPGAPADPTSPDRVWSSVFDWIATQDNIDKGRIVCWGFSTGGYYAIRLAHTHQKLLRGVVALGGGCHHMFDREWLDAVGKLEYPFDLPETLAHKFGYGNDLARFKREAARFSLLNDGTLDKPCARLLLVNGTHDTIFPIDDMYLLLSRGSPKEARLIRGRPHMGEPESFPVVLKWIFEVLEVKDVEVKVGDVLAGIRRRVQG